MLIIVVSLWSLNVNCFVFKRPPLDYELEELTAETNLLLRSWILSSCSVQRVVCH